MVNTKKISLKQFGLLGKNISYSFSQDYFIKKFKTLGLEYHTYDYFDYQELNVDFKKEILKSYPFLKGFNITTPYKEAFLPFSEIIDSEANEIGALNTIKRLDDDSFVGYNTDVYGFVKSIKPLLKSYHTSALILGNGGASKAVAYGLKKMGIQVIVVSREPSSECISYSQVDSEILDMCCIIVNCTPLGTYPNIEDKPLLYYEAITPRHLLYDLIYNPELTLFLSEGKKRGATIKNGYQMLKLQAEKAWEIWSL